VTNSDQVVRKATARDFEPLFGLVQGFATSFVPERETFDRSAARIVADEAAWLGVAERAGQLVGYCVGFDHVALYANGRVSWVEELMVSKDFRRQGVGRALMGAFEDWARARGSALVGLATRRAAPFYASLGYESSATFFRKVLAATTQAAGGGGV
jgi:GNAT superfamily N-acetyltransferase